MSQPRLFVPVRVSRYATALRLFRTPSGGRTAVAFSSPLRLAAVLGTGQQWVRLTEPALRGMTVELGVTRVVVDPAGTMTGTSAGVA
jgi:hypothetical protein